MAGKSGVYSIKKNKILMLVTIPYIDLSYTSCICRSHNTPQIWAPFLFLGAICLRLISPKLLSVTLALWLLT